jgi:DNA-binding response OmpR family regulator
MTGPELCREIRDIDTFAKVVICSSLERAVDRDMALKSGAADYLLKPDEFYRLATSIRRHIGTLPSVRNRLTRSLARSAAII